MSKSIKILSNQKFSSWIIKTKQWHNVIRKCFKNAFFSSNEDEVIRAVSNLFIFFHKKISHAQKAQNAYKRTKTKKAEF